VHAQTLVDGRVPKRAHARSRYINIISAINICTVRTSANDGRLCATAVDNKTQQQQTAFPTFQGPHHRKDYELTNIYIYIYIYIYISEYINPNRNYANLPTMQLYTTIYIYIYIYMQMHVPGLSESLTDRLSNRPYRAV